MLRDHDWLERVLQQFVEAIARIMDLRQSEDYDAALEILEGLFLNEARMPAFNWTLYHPGILEDLVGRDAEQLSLLARIFEERAEIEWARNRATEGAKALRFAEACRERLRRENLPDLFADLDQM